MISDPLIKLKSDTFTVPEVIYNSFYHVTHKNQILERRNMIMNNGRRIGLIMIITGATLWGLSSMIQWLFQHTNVSSIDF